MPESFFCIVNKAENGMPIGFLGIKKTNLDVWEVAIELDDEFTNFGYGPRSICLFLNEIHRLTGQKYFQARIDTDNIRSQKCFEKVGARLIGLSGGDSLLTPEEETAFEDKYLQLIDDHIIELAKRINVVPRKLLSHVLDYRIECPLSNDCI